MASVARKGGIGLVVVLLVGIAGMARGASTGSGPVQATLVKHVGPVGVIAGESASVVFTNGGTSTVSPSLQLYDEAGRLLAGRAYEVSPGASEVLEWVAPDPHIIWGRMTLNEIRPVWALALHIKQDPADGWPALITEVSPQRAGGTRTSALGPYVPDISVAKSVVYVANLGFVSTTFDVYFFDYDGAPLSDQVVTVAAKNTASVEFTGDTSNGVRAEVTAPDGARYLVTGAIVDPNNDVIVVYNWDKPAP